MGFVIRSRISAVAISALAVAAAAIVAILMLVSARSASADTFDDCPPGGIPSGTQVDPQVGASSSVSGGTVTYTFDSWANLNSSGGSPGLQEYCVYTSPLPDSIAVQPGLQGADTSFWTTFTNASNFGYTRPNGGGAPSNIPLDGTTGVTMGTATWTSVPSDQTIVLHINDPTMCSNLYGAGKLTCFVYPGPRPPSQNQDLTVSKTATPSFTRTYTWGIGKGVVGDSTQNTSGSATFKYQVSVTHDTGTDSGWQVTGTITVSNPNTATDFSGVNVSDKIDNGGSCTVQPGGSGGTVDPSNATIPASGSVDFPYTCKYSSAPSPSNFTNTATAAWDQATYNTSDSSATGTMTGDFASVTPTVVDGSVSVSDPLDSQSPRTFSSTDSSPITYSYSHTFSGDPAGTCTSHDNTATFTTNTTGTTRSASQTVTDCVGADLAVSKTATPSFTRTYHWGIGKAVDNNTVDTSVPATFLYTVTVTHDGGTDSNWQVTGNITVHNPNNWEAVTLTGVTDSSNGGACTVSGDTTQTIGKGGDSTGLTYSCTYASQPTSPVADTATATWDPSAASTPDGTATGTAQASFITPTTVVDGSVSVSDPLDSQSPRTFSSTDSSPITYSYSHTFSGDPAGTCTSHGNTATFTTSDTGTTGSASQTVKDCVGADLTVIKTATPSFTRTYTWGVSKSVDKTLVEQIGGTATFNYTVKVTHDGGTDGNWKVTGTITVTNPNDWEAVTANVTDAINNGGSCLVTGGTGASIPASSSKTFNYTCTYSSAPSPSSFTNTGTAAWDKGTAFTPDGSAIGTVSADFGSVTPKIVDGSVTVTDTLGGSLGTVSYTDPSPKMITYSHTFTVPTNNCVNYPNTATFTTTTGTTGSASQSVEVCGPAKTGALTMGFWQNKNGQTIIQKYSGTNCQALRTWLNQFHPFSDLTATACGSSPSLGATSASGVVGYVYNVIKAANASGASMNAMLKAQMLATALDVYFSDPSLGGNQINAPKPIGGVTIDLTKICHMIDSSNGTGSCSGTYENVSSAFGGATSKTVMNMLLYQNTADPAVDAGAAWYGNVKATQQFAKDAFDAINNQVAFSP